MAAALESALDLDVQLVEGHDGIYELTIDDEIVYTKRVKGWEGAPTERQIVEMAGRFLGLEPREQASSEPGTDDGQPPFCVLTETDSGE